uniref:hypothetical protein n=1 Tax=uncultured Bilophila sp. TaxID=529385 RepID=UPI0025E292A2|nr:hypothetical protein [uncultured Bilophila sp.]
MEHPNPTKNRQKQSPKPMRILRPPFDPLIFLWKNYRRFLNAFPDASIHVCRNLHFGAPGMLSGWLISGLCLTAGVFLPSYQKKFSWQEPDNGGEKTEL